MDFNKALIPVFSSMQGLLHPRNVNCFTDYKEETPRFLRSAGRHSKVKWHHCINGDTEH